MSQNKLEAGAQLERLIGYILIAGVVLSLALLGTGMVLYYIDYGNFNTSRDPQVYIHGKDFFTFIAAQIGGTSGSLSLRLITLGIAVLMLTPFIRVLISAIYFGMQKNIKFVVLTIFVLAVLTISLTLH